MGASGFFAAANNNNTTGAGVLPRLARDGISTSLSPGPASSSRSDVGGNGDDNLSSSCGGGQFFDEMGIITNHYPPITIPLSDILNVDEDRPTTSTATSSMYRIFLRSSTQGYFEFSTESNNSHDVCMAFLLAHLPHDRIVKSSRQQPKGGLPIEAFDNNTKQHGENNKLRRVSSATGVGMMLRTMVLTPTKQLVDDDNNIVLTPPPPRIVTSLDDIPPPPPPPPPPIPSDDYPRIRSCPSSPTHKISISSSTLSSCRSNAIDKLQTKVIRQHLRDYESSSVDTPLTRLVLKGKEFADRVRNNILDCQLCCVDTTTVSPLAAAAAESRDDGGSSLLGGGREEGGGGIIINDGTMGMKYQMKDDHHYNKSTKKKKSSSPDTETLQNRGIGGLSFEVESCSGLSWERSVCDS
jgi:hypothetical protein